MELANCHSLLNEFELSLLLSILPQRDFILLDMEQDIFCTGILTCLFSQHWVLLAFLALKSLAVPVRNIVRTPSSAGTCHNGV